MRPKIYFPVILFMAITGCMSEKKIERKYYTIEIPAGHFHGRTDSLPFINGVCVIDKVQVNQLYDKNLIVNRSGSNEVNFYIYHQWAVRPSDAIEEMIVEHLGSARVFSSVCSAFSKSVPDYRFSAILKRLEMVENNRSSEAALSLEFLLINNADGRIILSHKADKSGELKERALNLFAIEVSDMIIRELDTFIKMIKDNHSLFIKKN